MQKKNILILLIAVLNATALIAESRNALLIANGNYKNFSGLQNPVPEAEELAKSLKALGFDVIVKKNLSREQMMDVLYDFEKKLKGVGGIAFFHYGGHAVQVKGINYLIPADADIPDERRVENRAVNLDEVMKSMRGETNIVVLDACRNNPLPAGEGRSASRGLVPANYKPHNSIIVYSAQAGSTAQDGVFTPLLSKMITQEKSFTQIIRDVRVAVKEKTNNMQIPGSYDDSDTEIFLAGSAMAVETIRMEQSKKEYEDLENEIKNIKTQLDAKRNEKERQSSEIELQKKESLARQKKIELEEKQKLYIKRLALEKRKKEIQAEFDKNQLEQEKDFLSIQEMNAKKQKLLQESQKNVISLDDMIDANLRLKRTIYEITLNYNQTRTKSLQQIDAFYKEKYEQVNNMKKDLFELKEEFDERKKMELETYQKNEREEKEQINQRYDNEIIESTKGFKEQIKANQGKAIVVSKNVMIDFGEYNEAAQYFPGTIAYKGKYLSFDDTFHIDIKSPNLAERSEKGREILKKIKSKGYIGEIEQQLDDNRPLIKRYKIVDIANNNVIYQKEVYEYGEPILVLDDSSANENIRNLEHYKKNQWFTGKYQSHLYLYASLTGLDGAVGCGGIALVTVGALNLSDCITRNFEKGMIISAALLGVGVGLNLFSAITMPLIGGIWYKDARMNGRQKNKVKLYHSSRFSRRQRIMIGLNTVGILGGYDYNNEQILMGMSIKL